MEKKYLYVISDIHGEADLFRQALVDFQPETQQLVLIGDLLDRGPKVKESLLLGQELVARYGAVYLKGNHEDLFLRFLNDPEARYAHYLRNGGAKTVESLLHPGACAEYSPTEMALMIRTRYHELIEFLTDLPLYYEWFDYLFVHAGVDLELSDWRKTPAKEFMWIRQPFHEGENHTGKTIVFGHTITPALHGDNVTSRRWQTADRKIGIDGGGVYGFSIHGLLFSEKSLIRDDEFFNPTAGWQGEV